MKTNIVEVKKLAGIHLLMSVMSLPQVYMYWCRGTQPPLIADSMTRNRFYELHNHLQFVDSSFRTDEQKKDQLHLVRSVVDCFQSSCRSLPRTTCVSIDDQMIPFSGRCGFRQFLPSKTNPAGLKNSVLASPNGLALDFLNYTKKDTVVDGDMKVFGLGREVVKKLIETVISKNAQVFTDRYFTGLERNRRLLADNRYLTGTVNANRTEGTAAGLPKHKDMNRGEAVLLVREDKKVCLVKWRGKDNLLLSNAVGTNPMGSCKR